MLLQSLHNARHSGAIAANSRQPAAGDVKIIKKQYESLP